MRSAGTIGLRLAWPEGWRCGLAERSSMWVAPVGSLGSAAVCEGSCRGDAGLGMADGCARGCSLRGLQMGEFSVRVAGWLVHSG